MYHPSKTLLPTVSLVLLLLISAAPLRAQSSDQPLSLAQYRAELDAAIAKLDSTSEDETGTTIEELQEQFATITQVKLPNGEVVAIRSILDDLNTSKYEELNNENLRFRPKEVALARLRGAVTQIDGSAHDNTAARLAILAEVLARPEFNTPMTLWDRFWQWLENFLSEIMPNSRGGGNAGWLSLLIRALPWIISILIVATIIWLLSYWLQRLLRSFVTDERVNELIGDDDLPRSAVEARQQARAAAQSGLYRDAVRRLYLAALLQLAEHDLIRYERSLTNREVLIRVPNDSPIRPHLEPIISTFDQVWYGVHEPDQATFTQYEHEIDTLAALAQRTASASQTRAESNKRSDS